LGGGDVEWRGGVFSSGLSPPQNKTLVGPRKYPACASWGVCGWERGLVSNDRREKKEGRGTERRRGGMRWDRVWRPHLLPCLPLCGLSSFPPHRDKTDPEAQTPPLSPLSEQRRGKQERKGGKSVFACTRTHDVKEEGHRKGGKGQGRPSFSSRNQPRVSPRSFLQHIYEKQGGSGHFFLHHRNQTNDGQASKGRGGSDQSK
jgi:hypothetical protein